MVQEIKRCQAPVGVAPFFKGFKKPVDKYV